GRARAVNGTVSYMPSIFGLTLAGLVINHIIGDSRRV
ncbi:MAG: tRNA threonylcarbamoyladenosine dehydratase, partial [Pseudomonadota bacterium]|nr:tRNA threonylcarbamoyladenosine dehydratase [Pseudomonadota bacterium]